MQYSYGFLQCDVFYSVDGCQHFRGTCGLHLHGGTFFSILYCMSFRFHIFLHNKSSGIFIKTPFSCPSVSPVLAIFIVFITFFLPVCDSVIKQHLSVLCFTDVEVISKFAHLENRLGEPERAQTLMEHILTSYPKRVDVWSSYVDMLVKNGQLESAR